MSGCGVFNGGVLEHWGMAYVCPKAALQELGVFRTFPDVMFNNTMTNKVINEASEAMDLRGFNIYDDPATYKHKAYEAGYKDDPQFCESSSIAARRKEYDGQWAAWVKKSKKSELHQRIG